MNLTVTKEEHIEELETNYYFLEDKANREEAMRLEDEHVYMIICTDEGKPETK